MFWQFSWWTIAGIVVIILLIASIRIVKQYEQGVVLRFGRLIGTRMPGLRFIIPFVDVMHKVVAADRDAAHPVAGHHHPRQRERRGLGGRLLPGRRPGEVGDRDRERWAQRSTRSRRRRCARWSASTHWMRRSPRPTRLNVNIREILDVQTLDWGVEVTLVELKDILLPDSMKRAMAKQAEAEREKRAKIIDAEGESLAAAALGDASDTMMAHPLALQLRNLQTLVDIGVDKNTLVVFPAPLMSTIGELSNFLARESTASGEFAGGDKPGDAVVSAHPSARMASQPVRTRFRRRCEPGRPDVGGHCQTGRCTEFDVDEPPSDSP